MKPDTLLFGFLPVLKPAGPTSHDMVARLRRFLPKKLKVGHTGTLDPFASGVMIMAIGKATRFADDVHLLPKSYLAEIRLGQRTNTLDPTGEVDLECPVPAFDERQLAELVERFRGRQFQVPPVYSAKKVDGKRSYALARQHEEVALAPVEITLHELALRKRDERTLICETRCSTGTYIRALGRDLGAALGSCGHLTALSRTSVGPVRLEDCIALEHFDGDLTPHLWPVERLLPQIARFDLPADALPYLSMGRPYPYAEPAPEDFLCYFLDLRGVAAVFRCSYDRFSHCVHSKMLCYARNQEES